ncbi:MAG: outer membrane protein assembly factor BamA [candidate division Zixibacteria bacterium]|nr:outer membrane protein assembly factor BamA [candidate division Zixibacteria bacterium]
MNYNASRDLLFSRLLPVAVWAAVVLLMCGGVQAQTYRVVDIRVSGNTRSSEQMIRNTAALTMGSELSGTELQDAVKNLYAKGIFRDIAIDLDPVSGGVIVTIKVSEYPKLSALAFKGNKKISDKDLKGLLHIAAGGYISDNLMAKAKNQIETQYMSKGYFLAEAHPELLYNADSSEAQLNFVIKEYDKVKVEQVVLTGNQKLKASDLIGQMSNRKKGFLKSSDFKKEKFEEDKDKVVAFCAKRGFIDAHIVSDSFAVDTVRNRMTIYIDMYEGPKYYFGTTAFSGNSLISAERLLKVLKYTPGAVFNQEQYDESMAELYGAYQEEGYLRVRIMDTRQTLDSTINFTYDILEGLPSQIRLVEITGNTKTKDKVIRREMAVRPGQTFRRSVLMRSLRDVTQLNFFSNVIPDVRDLPSGDIDLIVKVEEKATGQVSAGAGYSATDKLVGNVGLGIPNFRGMGQNVSISVDFGSRRNSISLGFSEPWFFGTPTLVGGEIYNLNRVWYDDFTEGRRGGALRLGRRLRWPDNYTRLYWRYRLEDVRYYDFSDDYRTQNGDSVIVNHDGATTYIPYQSSLLNYGQDWLRTSAMSVTLERDSRDLPIFATSGSKISYTAELAGGFLGGSWKYFKHLVTADKYIPLKWGMALVGRSKFGYVSATDNEDIPYAERFAPGGVDYDGTVRGYPDASLSPRSASGTLLGGISEVIYNLELQIPVMKNQMYLIGFADAGRSWQCRDEIKLFSHLYRGVGVGFRMVVPGVGVIGFDFGNALDKAPGEKKGWRAHFQVSSGS